MLSPPPAGRIWLSTRPADLRKSFDGLAAFVRDGLGGDPFVSLRDALGRYREMRALLCVSDDGTRFPVAEGIRSD